jgi:hypothetical protein
MCRQSIISIGKLSHKTLKDGDNLLVCVDQVAHLGEQSSGCNRPTADVRVPSSQESDESSGEESAGEEAGISRESDSSPNRRGVQIV